MGEKSYVDAIADVIYKNGKIYTVNEGFDVASIIATRGDRIIYVGSDESVAGIITGPDTKIMDLGGKTVIPGLIEGHMHLQSEGLAAMNINAFKLTKEQILGLVREKAAAAVPGEWIRGGGWNQMD